VLKSGFSSKKRIVSEEEYKEKGLNKKMPDFPLDSMFFIDFMVNNKIRGKSLEFQILTWKIPPL